jgi:hypothetical protein
LKLALSQPNDSSRAWWTVGFGFGGYRDKLAPGDYVDAVVDIGENHWNGNSEIQVKILDFMKKSE